MLLFINNLEFHLIHLLPGYLLRYLFICCDVMENILIVALCVHILLQFYCCDGPP